MKKGQLAASNIHYRFHTLSDFFEEQEKIGVKQVELWGGTPHVWIDPYSSCNGRDILKQANEYGLQIPVFTPEFSSYRYTVGAKGAEGDKSMEYIKRCLHFATEVEAEYTLLEINGYLLDTNPSENWNHMLERLVLIAQCGKNEGVKILLMTNAFDRTNLLSSVKKLNLCLNEVSSSWIFPALDLAAMDRAGETISEWFHAFGSKIAHVHLSNYKQNASRHRWGDGYLCLDKMLDQLEQYHYRNMLGLVYDVRSYQKNPQMVDEQSMKWLDGYWEAEVSI